MPNKHPGVDAYIAKSAAFAKPILRHLRKVVHAGCPEVEETLKWGFPHFMYKGTLCSMARFKQHCAFGFWKASLLAKKHKKLADAADSAMGHMGRITAIEDLPSEKTLLKYIKDAMALNDAGIKPEKLKTQKPALKIPDYFLKAVQKNKKAYATFDAFSPSCQREYVEWVAEAKQEETRQRRMAQAVAWMAEGKPRNWKYMNK